MWVNITITCLWCPDQNLPLAQKKKRAICCSLMEAEVVDSCRVNIYIIHHVCSWMLSSLTCQTCYSEISFDIKQDSHGRILPLKFETVSTFLFIVRICDQSICGYVCFCNYSWFLLILCCWQTPGPPISPFVSNIVKMSGNFRLEAMMLPLNVSLEPRKTFQDFRNTFVKRYTVCLLTDSCCSIKIYHKMPN